MAMVHFILIISEGCNVIKLMEIINSNDYHDYNY